MKAHVKAHKYGPGQEGEDEEIGEGSADDDDNEVPDSNSLVQSAILLSFGCNILLLVMKGWMAIVTGSMSIIASTADSLLDLLSGVVLLMTERATHNVDHYKYPEGRARLEPIGVVIFATVMCLSSANIFLEALKRLFSGLLGTPPSLEVGAGGYAVLAGTIVIKLALWGWCQVVLRAAGKSSSVEAYAQDHLNDVLTNAVAVACVLAAATGGADSGWWVADPLGAAAISVWIMYSWWDVGKEHVDTLAGRSAPTDFLQRLTFIAANCDEQILQVDTVRAWYFGAKFLVEIHVVLDEKMPLREVHDVGEKLELMVEAISDVERCFVHMDYETDHAPEYKRRLQQSPHSPPDSPAATPPTKAPTKRPAAAAAAAAAAATAN